MATDGVQNLKDTKAELDYLKELLTDRCILASDPRNYFHVGKILEREILRIRSTLFASYGINTISENDLPEPEGHKVNLHAKVYMPADASNSFNFVGRILGPDGSTAKCLQQCLGVKIMVRGRGSMRDRKKEEANVGKPNWEHLNDRLHVVLTVEDYENRAKARLAKASEYITQFLKESIKGSDKEDKVKQMQLMELSFRRESSSWHFNCNNILDLNVPHKPGAILSNAANFVNFTYGYPSTSLFPSFHRNPAPPVHQFGQQAQQQPQHQQQQSHQPSAQHHTLPGHGGNQHTQLRGFSNAYPSNLNTTAFLFGHSPNSANYASPYSPSSHPHSAPTLPPGLTGLTPVNYWSGQGLSHLAPDYAFAHSQLHLQQVNTTSNSLKVSDDSAPLPSDPGAALTVNGSSAQVPNPTHTVYLSHHPLGSTIPEEAVPQYILTEYNPCSLDGLRDLDAQTGIFPTGGLYPPLTAELHSTKAPTNGSDGVGGGGSSAVTCNGLVNQHGSTHRRYSQKHASQTSQNSVSGPAATSASNARGVGGRSAVVTVRVGSIEYPHSPPSSPNKTETVSGFTGTKTSTPPKPISSDRDTKKLGLTTPVTKASAPLGPNSDVDWPKLGSDGHEKTGTNASPTVQPVVTSEGRASLT